MAVELHIEALVLHGFAAHDRHRIAAAMESELTRLLSTERNLTQFANPADFGRLNAGAFEVKAGSKPHEAGAQIARAVFRGLRTQAGVPAVRSQTRNGLEIGNGGGKP